MGNKQVRDTVFRDYFNDKEKLLSLGNALLGASYHEPEQVQINTLEGTFYSNIKNDISFMLGGHWLVLVEHQTSINANMPFRMLLYVCQLYKEYAASMKQRLYSSRLMRLPAPEFYVFYDGMDGSFDHLQMKLSDAFGLEERAPQLELVVECFNLNVGFSDHLKEQCSFLDQYSQFSNTYKAYRRQGMDVEHATRAAVKYSIDNNIMKEYLKQRKEEVVDMLDFEWNEDDYKAAIHEDGVAEGELRTKLANALAMLKDNMSWEKIHQYTLLPMVQIEKLARENALI